MFHHEIPILPGEIPYPVIFPFASRFRMLWDFGSRQSSNLKPRGAPGQTILEKLFLAEILVPTCDLWQSPSGWRFGFV